ncbi:hypothetical protein ACH5RR_012736 [Cinchona calisaya]|uniref:Uncharacterized protein n=1 Tax=Cinchona calisaya TaxID=153742 RepID=A0ABD3A8G2_9GENT
MNLMLVAHHCMISRERTLILYALVKGWTIDIGVEIYKSIRQNALQTNMDFIFPGVITALCAIEGVTSLVMMKRMKISIKTPHQYPLPQPPRPPRPDDLDRVFYAPVSRKTKLDVCVINVKACAVYTGS